MLRAMLMRGFGKNLLISGGSGNSAADPIVLTAQSAHDASWTEMEVAKCIYGQLGWHWKMVERVKVNSPQGALERFSCEVRYVEGTNFVTETRNFYFDVSQVNLESAQTTPVCGINLGANIGIGLPYQLEWLHFDSLTDNEADHSGLGVTVGYSAPNTKFTLYFYNKGNAEIDGIAQPEKIEREFESVCRDLFSVNPGAVMIAEDSQVNLMIRSFDIGGEYSVVALSTLRNHFFKLRATIESLNLEYQVDCFLDSLGLTISVAQY